MSARTAAMPIEQFSTFGDLLKFLRRRSGLTQRELAIAVGYSNTHICRLEQNQRMPDLPTISARFVPALGLDEEPKLVQRLVELAALVRREDVPASGLAPYKGLLHFDEGDADLFFGREALTARLTAKLMAAASAQTGARCLAIVGASGSGKSSAVRAGLVPALRWQPETAGWVVAVLTPTAHPLEALARAVLGEGAMGGAQRALVERMERDAEALGQSLQAHRNGGSPATVLMVVDQFEELFTLCRAEAERQRFVDSLLEAASAAAGPAVMVVTLRADFYGRCAGLPKLREALAERQEYIGGMTREELRQAIEAPAKAGSWELEAGLVEVMLKDVGAEGTRQPEPGALPLLSHALLETWERRRGRTLTLSGYAATGGVRGAIANTAEALFQDQLTAGQRDIARGLFLRMTELGADETQADTRRRAALDELFQSEADGAAVREVLTVLADARLVTTEAATAEIAHEALIREWPTLRGWLTEDRESLRVHRHLTEAAREWERMKRDEGAAYRGARLAQALEWAADKPDAMNPLEREFLEASRGLAERDEAGREAARQRELKAAQALAEAERHRAEAERARAEEQTRTGARLRQGNRIVTVVGLVALALAAVAGFFAVQANRNALQAEQSVQLSLSRQLTLQASSLLDTDHDLALLLSVEALRVADTIEARSALLTGLQTRIRIPQVLGTHAGPVSNLAISPDGAVMATSSAIGEIVLWDLATRRAIGQPLIGHVTGVDDLEFSPDGRLLASVGFDSRIILWNVSTRQPLGNPLTFALPIRASGSLAFSPSGSILAAGFTYYVDGATGELKEAVSGHVRLWDVSTLEHIADLSDSMIRWIGAFAFSPDGRTLAAFNTPIPVLGNTDEQSGVPTLPYISVWDLDNRQSTLIIVPPNTFYYAPTVLIYSHDGQRLAMANAFGDFDLWDLNTGGFLPQLPGIARVNSVAFSPDDRLLATGAEDGNVRLWDLATFQLIGQPLARHVLPVTAVAFTPDGRTLVSASEDGAVILWDLVARQSLGPPLAGHNTWINRVAFSPDGQTLASGGHDGSILLWDTASNVPLGQPLMSAPSLGGLAFSPDGKLIASGGRGGALTLLDAETHQPFGQPLIGHTGDITGLAFSPDGKLLASGSLDQSIRLWDVATGQPMGNPLLGHTGGVMAVAFSPDGKILASGSRDQTIRLWDVATGTPLGDPLIGHTNFITSITFAPDGATLASGSGDGSIRVWEVATRQAVGQTMLGHVGTVLGIAISPDGTLLASGGLDKTVRLWDLATRQRLGLPFTEHNNAVNSVAFSADGAVVASGSNDGTVRLWDVSLASWQARACAAAGRNLTRAEWETYVPGRPYQVTCEAWPAGT